MDWDWDITGRDINDIVQSENNNRSYLININNILILASYFLSNIHFNIHLFFTIDDDDEDLIKFTLYI